MSEATKKALLGASYSTVVLDWPRIVCAIDAHVKSEVAAARVEAEPKPEPGPGAKGPPETLLTVLDDDGYHIETRDADDANTAVVWVRADVVEKRVAYYFVAERDAEKKRADAAERELAEFKSALEAEAASHVAVIGELCAGIRRAIGRVKP